MREDSSLFFPFVFPWLLAVADSGPPMFSPTPPWVKFPLEMSSQAPPRDVPMWTMGMLSEL